MINDAKFRFASATALVSLMTWLPAVPARAGELATSWVDGFNNKVRLVAGKAGSPAKAFAGLEISMPSGWKTYWRNPGEAGGVPPEFDFTGSENIAAAEVLYPVPQRLVDPKAGENIGYKEHVTFPIALQAKDLSKPISLKTKVSYGVCKDICVPAEAELTLEIPPDLSAAGSLERAVASVPVALKDSEKPGTSGAPVLKEWRIDQSGKPKLVLDALIPGGGEGADAFLFSPDGLYLPMTKKLSSSTEGAKFEADLTDGVDLKTLKGKPVSVTLAGAKGQSETVIQIP